MSYLGASHKRVKALALAEELATTVAFVPQIVGPLVRAGWVRSDPGPTGGYVATASLDDVSVLDVIEAVDGATDAGRCVVADRPCRADAPCVLHHAWGRARTELVGALAASPMSGVGRSNEGER